MSGLLKLFQQKMNTSPTDKKQSTLKQKFKDLIQDLRGRTTFENKPHLSFDEMLKPIEAQLDQQMADIVPSTHSRDMERPQQKIQEVFEDNPSQMLQQIKSLNSTKKDAEIEIDDVQSEHEVQHNSLKGTNEQLLPDQALKKPFNEGRIGQIKHQNTSITLNLSKMIQAHKQKEPIRYSKIVNKSQYKHQMMPIQTTLIKTQIKDLNDLKMIKYWNSHNKLTQTSSQIQINRYFELMIDQLSIDIEDATINRYKNCIYFGEKSTKTIHSGIIYYFNQKIYYGELFNGIKHGQGVQINFLDNIKYAGVFNGGSKNGYFFVQKEKQNYQGVLNYGLYHGNGKLMTQDYIYQGGFQNGKKHGFGQEIYPKTGLKVQGYFKEGQYQHLNEVSKKRTKQEQHLPQKQERTQTLKKSESYDLNIDLTSKLMKRQIKRDNSSFTARNDRELQHSEEAQNIKQLEFQEDSTSLFNMLQNKKKPTKYDIYVDQISKKLPKVLIQALPHRQKRIINPEQSNVSRNDQKVFNRNEHIIVNRKTPNNNFQEQNNVVLSKFTRNRARPIHYSAPKSSEQINQSPLNRRKQSIRPC